MPIAGPSYRPIHMCTCAYVCMHMYTCPHAWGRRGRRAPRSHDNVPANCSCGCYNINISNNPSNSRAIAAAGARAARVILTYLIRSFATCACARPRHLCDREILVLGQSNCLVERSRYHDLHVHACVYTRVRVHVHLQLHAYACRQLSISCKSWA